MPSFSEHVDCEIDVSPDEFVDKCTNREIEKLIDRLEETPIFMKRYYEQTEADEIISRNYSYLQFCQQLNHLKKDWYQISKEDAEIISVIAKKYGAL